VDIGIEKINDIKPDLVFLDVVMPPTTGFDLMNHYKQILFEVIFTTSYEKYAVDAFKVSAVDYLLKPFGVEQLKIALDKFELRHATKTSLAHIETLLHNINCNTSANARIALPTLTGYTFEDVKNIIRCQADNVYATFYMVDKRQITISKTLKECEELLQQFNFIRVHQSHLINILFVKEYTKGEGGTITMTDGSIIDVSRRKKDDFLRMLNKI
jgi:two-component system LytT family response regulator